MDKTFIISLACGAVAMLLIMLYNNKYYHMPMWKIAFSWLALLASGMAGIYLMFYVENGHFGGQSFFGAIFFVPLSMSVLAKMLRVKPGELLDVCAPAGCMALAALKVRCFIAGCCEGIVLRVNSEGIRIRFPSQIAELAATLLIALLLVWFIMLRKHKGNIYSIYLISYGICRFILNCLRDTTPVIWKLAFGHIWSIVAVVLGIIFTALWKRSKEVDTTSGGEA